MAFFESFRRWLQGWPDGILTVSLIAAGIMLWIIALHGNATQKAIAAAYVFFP